MVLLQQGEKRKKTGARTARATLVGSWLAAGLTLLIWGAAPCPAQAQAPTPEDRPSYTRLPVFKIPFQTDPGDHRLKEIQLYVSPDQGHSWHPYTASAPDQGFFKVTADHDGWLWFAVRTVDAEGRTHPLTVDGLRPGLKVCVDTKPPVIDLRPLPPRDGTIGAAWDVRDDNLDLGALRLDYRPAGSPEWAPVRIDPTPMGQTYWKSFGSGQGEVRLQAADLAGNTAEKTIALGGQETTPAGSAAGAAPTVAPVAPASANPPLPGDPAVRMVNSKRISLNFKIKDVGSSGVQAVELWYTQDGRSWTKLPQNLEPTPPFVFVVSDEGLYGFRLVVRSGVGLGGTPPQVGDAPQVWVEVDTTKPVVRLTGVEVGRGSDAGKMTISWEAADKNLSREPITISYAQHPTGPWTPLGSGKLENTGRYLWQMPKDVPPSVFIRVEAVDRAGNVGVAQTETAVPVDMAEPKAEILDVGPGQ